MPTRLIPMKQQNFGWRALIAIATIGLVCSSVEAVTAQTTVDPLQDLRTDSNNDIFSNRGGNASGGVFDLIHRAMQGSSKSADDFNQEQRESLDSATAEFRAKREALLRKQQQTTPANPAATTPATPAP